ncbi:MAG: sugar phosphate isomerase/epimerase [Sphaerochaetaceae bacterium]|nr:sugar phosphate isomerase/epimerase [Sphaerochaetaceae bacterium]
MRISTSTNIHQLRDKDSPYSAAQSVRIIKQAGFEAVDISMNTASLPGGPISDAWERWTDDVAQALCDTALKATQSHAIFRSGTFHYTPELDAHIVTMTKRDIIISGRLGIPWTVIHPLHGHDTEGLTHQQVLERNLQWYRQFADLAANNHVGIAIENMFPDQFTTADDLLELLDRLGDNQVFGVCWDTGHANIMKQNQEESILKLGPHLKATHIADNRGRFDDHTLPYLGNIDWKHVAKALKASGYGGDFTYEIHELTRYMPSQYHMYIMKFAVEIAKDIIGD